MNVLAPGWMGLNWTNMLMLRVPQWKDLMSQGVEGQGSLINSILVVLPCFSCYRMLGCFQQILSPTRAAERPLELDEQRNAPQSDCCWHCLDVTTHKVCMQNHFGGWNLNVSWRSLSCILGLMGQDGEKLRQQVFGLNSGMDSSLPPCLPGELLEKTMLEKRSLKIRCSYPPLPSLMGTSARNRRPC